MKTIRQFPSIALAFGVIGIGTAATLYFSSPRWLNLILAVFWFITGLLGLYQGLRK
jgi:hypothetical protein